MAEQCRKVSAIELPMLFQITDSKSQIKTFAKLTVILQR